MKAWAATILTFGVILAAASATVVGQDSKPGSTAPMQTAKATVENASEKMLEESYILTWEADPRYRGRDPFMTVLTSTGATNAKVVQRVEAPRTPGEERIFTDRADSYVKEAIAALEEADYGTVKDRLELLDQMVSMRLVTLPAKEKMAGVIVQLADVKGRYSKMRARAALTEALQLAALMQAYFESDRHSEVITAAADLEALDTQECLRNPDVWATGREILEKCEELKNRATIHIEFGQKSLQVEAVSHFPEGRSYAIINGEVFGEGVPLAPELVIASVTGEGVIFAYKGEQISLGLAQ